MVAGSEMIGTIQGQCKPDVIRVRGSSRRRGKRRELSNLFPPSPTAQVLRPVWFCSLLVTKR